ncbi:MAG TPA: hypothetical protein VFC33_13605 [Acidimicrobiia bacterium]|nr:hypothetical protein [Acidimicrobiia bacterium]
MGGFAKKLIAGPGAVVVVVIVAGVVPAVLLHDARPAPSAAAATTTAAIRPTRTVVRGEAEPWADGRERAGD